MIRDSCQPHQTKGPTRSAMGMSENGLLLWLTSMMVAFLTNAGFAQGSKPADAPIHVLKGHQRWVLTLAFSPDGKHLLSGGDDQTMRRWDLNSISPTPELLRRFSSPVTAMAFSPKGDRLAVGTWGRRLEICSIERAEPKVRLIGHQDSITRTVFDPTGNYLASGSADDSLIVWDTKSGDELLTLSQGNEYDVTAAAYSPDGARIATGDGENQIKLWDADTGAEVDLLDGHSSTVTDLAFDPKSERLISSSWDQTVCVWSVKTGDLIAKLHGHEAEVTAIAFSPDGKTIISASEDGTIRLWDSVNHRSILKLKAHLKGILCLAVSRDGRLIASGSEAEIKVWKLSINPS